MGDGHGEESAPTWNSAYGRFLVAYRAWRAAEAETETALQRGDVMVAAGRLADGLSWAVELDAAWTRLDGDAYTRARAASGPHALLEALATARRAWGTITPMQIGGELRMLPLADLTPADPVTAGLYEEHLAGRGLNRIYRDLVPWFEDCGAGTGGHVVREYGPTILLTEPPQDDYTRAVISDAEALMNGDPVLEAEQTARGWRHLTVVHGPQGEGEDFRGEITALGVVLNFLIGAPPPFQIGAAPDRQLIAVGPPEADQTVRLLELLARQLGGDAWQVYRGLVPGDVPVTGVLAGPRRDDAAGA
ncbi:hypothetical protein [Marinactinospora rubrisoli]|uniref:Uncharacterized protein n=1 Tax=Marinactinospora rubrisoli TaxID=2715399 RepID=A0ABW2KPW1_9ACTN